MLKFPKLWTILSLLVIASMLVVGCGATPTPTATAVPPTPTRAAVPTAAPAATTAAAAAPTATKAPAAAPTNTAAPAAKTSTFIFGAQGDPVCLDPAIITDGISARVTNQVFEGLVKYDKDTTNVVAALAEKWTVSDDGKIWTFNLRKGIKFQDGTDFDAASVVFNWDYWANTKNALHDAQIKAKQVFEYYEAQFGGFDGDSIISKVEAIDPATVKFTLKDPQAPFLQNMAMFVFTFWSPKALTAAGVDSCKKPVGTGAFKFVEWKPNESVTLDANADYWDKANAPKVSRIIIRSIKDSSQRLAALKAGEIHGMEGLNPSDVKPTQADANLQVLLRPANTTGYVAFNFNVKEFQMDKVRQAFAVAINKKAIVDALYGGTGQVAKEFLPPSLWGYNKSIQDFANDTAAAKKLLADAGFPNGLSEITWADGKKTPLEFWYMPVSRPYYPNPKETAEAMAADLAKAGINVKLQTVDWTVYLDKRTKGEMPLYMLGWTGDNGDPDNFLCYFFCMDAKDSPIAREGFYADKEVSDLLKKAAVTIKQADRDPMYQKAEQIIHDKIERVFIANNQPPLAFSKKVTGYIVNPTATEYFNTVAVAP
jgi:peptide/nickel transport system substrate-binding protein